MTGLQHHTHHAVLGLSAVLQQSWVEGPTSTPTWPLLPPCLRTLHPTFPSACQSSPVPLGTPPLCIHSSEVSLPLSFPSVSLELPRHIFGSHFFTPHRQPSSRLPATTTDLFALTFDPKAWASIPSAWDPCPVPLLCPLTAGLRCPGPSSLPSQHRPLSPASHKHSPWTGPKTPESPSL